jgi:SAM-dependent methyltransferase
MRHHNLQRTRTFYDSLYKGQAYASGEHHGERFAWLLSLLQEKNGDKLRFLEIGCGRGHLQHAVPGYIGLDISLEAGRYLEKPFVCAAAEALPFIDQSLDLVASFDVLEHLSEPEAALEEMARVLKPGGTLILAAAWRVTPWKPLGLETRPYQGLPLGQRVLKFCLPWLDYFWVKGIFRISLRARRELAFFLLKRCETLHYLPLTPNREAYLQPDSDATISIDNHACALWLHQRGFAGSQTGSAWQRICLRSGALVMEKS